MLHEESTDDIVSTLYSCIKVSVTVSPSPSFLNDSKG